MDDDKKKIIKIALVIVCLATAGIILKSTFAPSSPKGSNKPAWLICGNGSCKAQYSIEQDELRELMQEGMGDGGMMMPMQAPLLRCKECGKKSAKIGVKCINDQCGLVFLPNYMSKDGITDRCPKCGASAIEQRRQESRK